MRFEEVVDFAIRKEEEAAAGYRTASEMVERKSVREMLLSLARQEDGHRQKLAGIDRERLTAEDVRSVQDLRIADYTDSAEISATMDYQDVLTLAMKREEKAHNLYSTLASNTRDPELRKLFEFLAAEEAKHKLALEKEYDEHVLTDN